MSQKFKRKSLLYHHFASRKGMFDFSDDALLRLYNHESYGTVLPVGDATKNGFVIGKKWLNWHITNWKHALVEGSISRHDLLSDIPDVDGYREMVEKVINEAYVGQTFSSILEHGTWWEVKPPKKDSI